MMMFLFIYLNCLIPVLSLTIMYVSIIPIISLLTFGICLAVGLTFIQHQSDVYQQNMLSSATTHATEAMEFFSDEFDKALAPLFVS